MNKLNHYEQRVTHVPITRPIICGVYKITCIPNGRIYIGSSVDIHLRWEKHKCGLNTQKHYNKHFLAAYNKYGKNNFKWEIIEECSRENLHEREQYYLDLNQPFEEKGFNTARIVKAPMTGRKHTLEDREKMSRVQKALNKKCPEELKRYFSQLYKGRKRSQEAIEKGAAKLRGRTKSEEHKAKIKEFQSSPNMVKIKKERMKKVWQQRRNGRDCYLCLIALWAQYNNFQFP
jgi:group I intron endonuclease